MIPLNQKDARKKKILIRNDKKVGMWAVQSRKTVRGFGHCQEETLPMETRKKLRDEVNVLNVISKKKRTGKKEIGLIELI